MEAYELRLGNLVEYNGCVCVVSSIMSPKPMKDKRFSDKYIIELYIDGLIDVTIDEISPLPITEQRLLDFQFRKSAINLNLYRLRAFTAFMDEDNDVSLYKDNGWLCVVRSVHHLQNIYFTLTGTDLPF